MHRGAGDDAGRGSQSAGPAIEQLCAIGRSTVDDDVCQAVAARAFELNPSAVILVTLYDPARRVLRPRVLLGLGPLARRVIELVGQDPMRMTATLADITDEERARYVSGRMERLPHGLHSVAARKVPAPVIDAVAALAGLRDVFGVGFALNGHPYGGLMIAPRQKAALGGARELEVVVAFAGAVIRRLHADEEKTRAIARISGGMAHEYNNLLTVVVGNLAYALELGVPGPAQREALEDGRVAAERAARLTRQLLAFGRREAIRPEVLVLDEVVARARPRLEAAAAPIALHVALGATGGTASLDRAHVEHVLAGLVEEMCGWNDGHGAIELTSRRVALDGAEAATLELPPGAYVELRLRTEGAPERGAARGARLEPFLGAIHAYGMNVAAADGALRQCRGALHVDVAPGPVTTIRLVWPEPERPSTPPPASREVARAHAGARVLVVDDEEPVGRALARVLETVDYEVVTASSGRAAIDAVRAGRFDVVLADVRMGGEGGPELAARLGEVAPGLPVVYVSGLSKEALCREGVLGPDAPFVHKPATRAELCAAIDAALRRRGPA
jgi:CheY-like chemotaxis protein